MHRTDKNKKLIIQYLLEGNNKEDLAEQVYDLLPEHMIIQILDEIDNAQMEEDHAND